MAPRFFLARIHGGSIAGPGTFQFSSPYYEITENAGQAVITEPGEWVRYSTPEADGAEYIAICLPAFSPDTVHRDA